MKTLWRGTRLMSTPDFPLLLKFIFPTNWLSIQVHPNDAYASVHEKAAGGRGKTEMWHIVSAEPDAKVLVGLKAGVNRKSFLELISTSKLEDLLEPHPVSAGDTLFVPAGTPHTIGPGMVICEVQEYSDLTYRVYDYDRVDAHGKQRELHIEKALEVINFGKSVGGKISGLRIPYEGADRYLLAGCEYFAAERWECTKPVELYTNAEWFQLLVVLNGSGKFSCRSGTAKYNCGETWFIPACLDPPLLAPNEPTTLLLAYVPDLTDLKNNVLESGFDEKAISSVIFQ
jgi:mannose-6-phosphate isomerase